MYNLNYDCGRSISHVMKNDKILETIYLYDEKYKCSDKCNKKCCDYHQTIKTQFNHIMMPENIVMLPSFNNLKHQISVFYITGAQGTGKSVIAAKLMKLYKHKNKGCPIYCISECKSDDTIDSLISKKITPLEIKEDNLTFEDFQGIATEYGSICLLFDDIDSVSDVKQKGVSLKYLVYQLLNSLINNSRKYNINIIYTSHKPLEGAYSKTILNSCSNWIYFNSNITNNIKNCMLNYMGLTKKQMKNLLELQNTRWTCINRTIPITITTEKETFILEPDLS